ncbi:hypothetical protein INR49_015984 [Caranx melampygus]|nr:hypothetical protein INR49_015984 [Caranx melampygus]
MTFIMDPLLKFPGLREEIRRSFHLLQGDSLMSLTDSMMGNLMLVFRQDHLGERQGEEGAGRAAACTSSIPLWLLGRTKAIRKKLINYFLPHRMSCWSNTSQFIRRRAELFDQYDSLRDSDKAGLTTSPLTWLSSLSHSTHSSGSHDVGGVVKQLVLVQVQSLPPTDSQGSFSSLAILWASVGNTVPATFWAMYHLVRDPEALQVVRQEIHDVLRISGMEFSGDRDVGSANSSWTSSSIWVKWEHWSLFTDLSGLLVLRCTGLSGFTHPWLTESAINESLRLSSASMNIRVVQEDFDLRLDSERSVPVRKGDIIALYPQSMHMDPNIYEEPQTFRFDRYIQDGRERTDFYKDNQKLKYFLMPFGSGSSMCPGRFFAINEIKQFLCLLLLYFDLQLEDNQTRVTLDSNRAGLGILQPATDVRFRYRLRRV